MPGQDRPHRRPTAAGSAAGGRIPESWIPPEPVLEARALVRLYKDVLDERTG